MKIYFKATLCPLRQDGGLFCFTGISRKMSKRLLIGLMAIVVALFEVNFSSTIGVPAQCLDEMIIPDSMWALSGDTVRVPVYGRVCGGPPGPCEGENLDGIAFRVDYDTTYLRCIGVDYEITGTDNLGNSYTTLWDVLRFLCPFFDCFRIEEGYVYGGIVGSLMGTPDWPQDTYRFWDLLFEVSQGISEGHCCPIQLTTSGHASNWFIYNICNDYPVLSDGSICAQPKDSVICGDITGNGQAFTIADLIFFVEYYQRCPGILGPEADVDSCLGVTWNDIAYYAQILKGTRIPHCPPSPPPLPSTSDSLIVSDVTAAPGDTGILVTVNLANSVPLSWISIPLAYDSAILECNDIVLNESLFEDWGLKFTWIDPDSGLTIIGLVNQVASDSVPALGPGRYEIANLLFSVNPSTETTTVVIDTSSTSCYWLQANCLIPVFLPGEFVITTGLNGPQALGNIPEDYELSQNYPNPFNSTTLIRYAIPDRDREGRPRHTTLEVYNILGEKVATLVNEKQTPGYKAVTWDAKDMASGVYFYRLKAGDFVLTRKLMLLK